MLVIRNISTACLLATLWLVTACGPIESLPLAEPIEGCYYLDGSRVLRLQGGTFESADTSISGRYMRGEGEAGTYVIFQPAIHLDARHARLVRSIRLERNYLLTIRRGGHSYIRIPTEPLGEDLLQLDRC